jgi:hypothetical protein
MKDKRKIIYWAAVIVITIIANVVRLAWYPDSSLAGYMIGIIDMCACNVAAAFLFD